MSLGENPNVKADGRRSYAENKAFKDYIKSKVLDDGKAEALEFTKGNLKNFVRLEWGQTNKNTLRKNKQTVSGLQKLLNKAGFKAGVADNVFGGKTLSALINFQKSKGLKPDGIAGKQTLNAFDSNSISTRSATRINKTRTSKLPETTPKSYDGKKAIQYISDLSRSRKRELTSKLGISTNSSDKKIARYVVAFQIKKGLYADGIPGKNTRAKLGFSPNKVASSERVSTRNDIITRSASINRYLKHSKWKNSLAKLYSSVERLEKKPLAIVSDISQGKSLVIKGGKVQEVSAVFGNGTTPKKLRYAYGMNLASSPNVDASNTGKSATVLGGVLDFGDTKHVHGVAQNRRTTNGCIGFNTNYMHQLCTGLLPNASEAPWRGWSEKRNGKVNKYGFRSEPGTAKRYKLKTRIPVLTV